MKRYVLAVVLMVLAMPVQAGLPMIGLSASKESYVDQVSAPENEIFTIHACAFGGEDGESLDQPLTALRWVVYQACCGASLELINVTYNPELQHSGNPIAGVVSRLPACRNDDAIWLATLQVRLRAPGPGNYLWAAGSFGFAEDCEGEDVRFNDMPLQMIVPGDGSWSALHAEFYDGPRRY
ncbi:MAG: hypothetical protein GY838_00975 [bacterium]|nr:hypothetical protein [bacterium]